MSRGQAAVLQISHHPRSACNHPQRTAPRLWSTLLSELTWKPSKSRMDIPGAVTGSGEHALEECIVYFFLAYYPSRSILC